MTVHAEKLTELAEAIKVSTDEPTSQGLYLEIYEQAEEVVMCKGNGLFTEEFNRLSSVVKSNDPILLNIENGKDERTAWEEIMSLAIQAGVVEHLTAEQTEKLLAEVRVFDNGVDVFVHENKDTLTATQICQIYIAQTASFYYVFDKETEPVFDGCVEVLLGI